MSLYDRIDNAGQGMTDLAMDTAKLIWNGCGGFIKTVWIGIAFICYGIVLSPLWISGLVIKLFTRGKKP